MKVIDLSSDDANFVNKTLVKRNTSKFPVQIPVQDSNKRKIDHTQF